MEENREPLSAIAIEKKLQLLRNKHFSEDTIALVKSDSELLVIIQYLLSLWHQQFLLHNM